jgi:hypothetical protein
LLTFLPRDADRDTLRLGDAVLFLGDRPRLGDADRFADRLGEADLRLGDFLPAIDFYNE